MSRPPLATSPRSPLRLLLLTIALVASALVGAAQASATALTPGDVVVYRVGSGSGALSSGAFPVFLDEYDPSGKLVESVALPTAASGSNKPLLLLVSRQGNDIFVTVPAGDGH